MLKNFRICGASSLAQVFQAAVTSCTSGLHLSLLALGIGRVISNVPAFTWVSTASVVENVGAKVVFCDIDPKTFNLDIVQLASVINKNCKAIIPVHLFGLAAEMDEIARISAENNLLVIEDAACGFAIQWKTRWHIW